MAKKEAEKTQLKKYSVVKKSAEEKFTIDKSVASRTAIKNLYDREYEDALEDTVSMPKPNYPIEIYRGRFWLVQSKIRVEVEGQISFEWIPKYGTIFFGDALESRKSIWMGIQFHKDLEIFIEDKKIGNATIDEFSSAMRIDKPRAVFIKGHIKDAFFGDRSKQVDEIRFSLPNFIQLNGASIQKIKDEQWVIYNGRIKLIAGNLWGLKQNVHN